MFELTIMLSRLIFVFLGGYFLLLGAVFVANERDYVGYDRKSSAFHQRFAIFATHILAFLILSYNTSTLAFDPRIAFIGVAFLVVFVYAQIVYFFFFRNSCPLIINGMFYMLDIGIIMLTRLDTALAQKQIVWIFAGITLTLFIPLVFRLFTSIYKLKYVFLAVSWVLVLLPFFYGKTVYGATNWVSVMGLTFQPSEILKFFYLFYLASVFMDGFSFRKMIVPSVMAGGIVICLVVQRDLGGALILFMAYMVTLYISSGNALIFIGGMSFAAIVANLAYGRLSHVRRRVAAWKNPFDDVSDTGYQIAQSLFAMGTGGILGAGLTRGYPLKIPVVTTDFIFAAICEEFGMLFGLFLIGVLVMILFRGVVTALRADSTFNALIAATLTTALGFQSFLILGGVIKFIPMTGVTLPFVSYGGTSVVVSIIMVGILMELSKQLNAPEVPEISEESYE